MAQMFPRILLTITVVAVLSTGLEGTRSIIVDNNEEARLHMFLFENYNKHLRPVVNKSRALTVRLGLTLHQIASLVEKSQFLQTSLWVRQMWRNEYLTWDPKEFGGISTINVNVDKVWVPDIYLYNNADADGDGALNKFGTQIKLLFNGINIWLAPVLLTSSCKIDVTYFPFDEQHCSLKFGSWTYDGERLDLVSESPSGDVSKYVPSGQWDLVSFTAKRNEIFYVCCPQSYPDVTFTLNIRRKTIFYYMNLIMPCFLITGLTLLSFFLPPESGERITLVITNLLAMTVFMLLVADWLPPTSEVVPLISMYYTLTMMEVGLALVATCLVLKCYFMNPVTTEMPFLVRLLVLKWLAKLTRVKVPPAIKTIKTELCAEEAEVNKEMLREKARTAGFRRMSRQEPSLYNNNCDDKTSLHSRRLSGDTVKRKVSFFQAEYPSYQAAGPNLLHARNIVTKTSDFEKSIQSIPEIKYTDHNADDQSDASSISDSETDKLTSMLVCRQENIANNLRRIVKIAQSKEEEDLKREEWKVVAEIIDKFFFMVFFVMMVSSTIVIFMQAPRYSLQPLQPNADAGP